VPLRQSYLRLAKRAAMVVGRNAHAKQFNRHHRELHFLRTRLGRLIRDIRRKIRDRPFEDAFQEALSRASQIRSQRQRQRGFKLYSFHAPEVECIGKGKARAPYEFGVKVSMVATNQCAPAGQFVRHAQSLPGNPYGYHAKWFEVNSFGLTYPSGEGRLVCESVWVEDRPYGCLYVQTYSRTS
jgi:IS5 family transposase